MSAIKIVAETLDTVTITRADWHRLLAHLDDAEDVRPSPIGGPMKGWQERREHVEII
jgi:hypothetical protein